MLWPEGLAYSKYCASLNRPTHQFFKTLGTYLKKLNENAEIGRPSSASLNHAVQLRAVLSKICSSPEELRLGTSRTG